MTNIMDRMQLQSNEFNALEDLIKRYKNLPSIVDDDYPEQRHYYESALRSFLEAVGHNNNNVRVPDNYTSIVQPWAAKLGLRHQGVLVSAVRGCDSISREDRLSI